ncbi:MAG: NDP-hexose 4-ketoreductase [Candidatus Omnitrophica bacterium CG11_big_fil_rev_8_21_14_0_20_45_26]|uniref:NDP-hexose 4-ketoreductase n=1 Tax=Candidatus Abzuiibacterium crystallinum TaxID=1974748 RepID=A0A2H0LNQ4_9BACT|nr:MAG: NDP-hexose 4-ketoreductase [Candidatus Omnitrophica bacterium CG11_big_fil_rev_8_21_14_0_20_45_26]PIW63781.1 MAG: NDP-hexose 4-ketoreductase [Candidatus Omnitrophica bacterium CG12_big_fil_rev_8_21_14_0_65_45_16]
MFDRFTERARKVIILAKEEAKRFNHDYIGTEHILLGLIKEGESVAAAVLQNLGLSLDTIRLEVEKLVQFGPSTIVSGDIPFTPKAKKVIELAMDEARRLGHNYIGTEHLLLGLIKEGEGVASHVLMNIGLDLNKVRQEVIKLLGSSTPSGSGGAQHGGAGAGTAAKGGKTKTPALDAFGRDLSQLARDGKLDPVVNRQDEIERVIQILARRTKNNPVLLGEAGVGKTAIVEGLAQRINSNDVPEVLIDKRIVVLDLALMVAGTKYRGQFEERIKSVMDEIRRSENVVIFIDELHTLVGAGGAEGAIDASNILKPALSRGEIQCIGATTLDEYRKYIEKDAALARRFQMINVDPPSVEETVAILKGLRDRYEAHHRVKITDEAIESAAKLSDRYITERFLPDKAIDLIDEAGSRARLSVTTLPKDLKKLEAEIEQAKNEKEAAIKGQDFERAAKLRDKERQAKEELNRIKKSWKESKSEVEIQVTGEDIAVIVSKWTGVPLQRLEEKETSRLLRTEEELHRKVIGQDEAIKAIGNAIRRSRSGLRNPRRPIANFIFLGPTGVGKTLLARALAEFMFGNLDAVVQIDMSEYGEKFNVSRLVGAPPGYVGYEEGGQLTEKIRRRPYAVVLLDEIEKAHPDVFNVLLQVMEDGRLTDSFGRKVDFRNCIIIMTSNVGIDLLKKQGDLGFKAASEDETYEKMKDKLLDEAKKTFRPEFLNRVDDIIVFHQLTRDDLNKVIDIELGEVRNRLKDRGIDILLSPEVISFLIDKGYDPNFGARPLKRTIQKYIENILAEDILAGKFKEGDKIKAEIRGDFIAFEKTS